MLLNYKAHSQSMVIEVSLYLLVLFSLRDCFNYLYLANYLLSKPFSVANIHIFINLFRVTCMHVHIIIFFERQVHYKTSKELEKITRRERGLYKGYLASQTN